MNIVICTTSEPHFAGLYQALDEVAREKHYLAFVEAPPVDEAFAFFRNIVANDLCQFIAIENGKVVGWCDVLPKSGKDCAGVLGMGVIPSARKRGIGSRLLEAAIERAWAKGLSRIELLVRMDNAKARSLYERFGFVVEGINPRGHCVDGEYFDVCAMALLR